MDSDDRIVYAVTAFPVAAVVTYVIGYPLGLSGVASVVVFLVAWWATYRVSSRVWPRDDQ